MDIKRAKSLIISHLISSFFVYHRSVLRGLETSERFSVIFSKGDNFYDLLFGFLHTKPFLEKGLTLKGNNSLSLGAHCFHLSVNPIS